jgi:hypothetical protein
MEVFFYNAAVDGIIGSLVMSILMWLITNSGLANCNMIGAIGSMLTEDRNKENIYGAAIYLAGGISFSIIYNLLLSEIFVKSPYFMISASVFIGFVHGLVVSYAIIAVFSFRHTNRRFQNVSIGIGIAHLVAHMFFGFTVGVLFSFQHGLLKATSFDNTNPFLVYAGMVVASICVLMFMFSLERKFQKTRKKQRIRKRVRQFARH